MNSRRAGQWLIALASVIGAVALWKRLRRVRTGDEDSIRVKSGGRTLTIGAREWPSLVVEAVDGEWSDDGQSEHTHNSPRPHRGRLAVMVHMVNPNGAFSASGQTVSIDYSTGATAEFSVKGNGSTANPYRTKVKLRPPNSWSHPSQAVLLSAGAGEITQVKVDNELLMTPGGTGGKGRGEIEFVAICTAAPCV